MGLFGNDDQQDKRLDELERHMRRVTEQIGQLSIDLSQTRMELLKTRAAVSDTVKGTEVDPIFGQLNKSISEARTKLLETQSAADDSWAILQDGSDEAVETLRSSIEGAWARLDETSG